ncbi:MAG TPA: ABC transporter permease, partial [Bryobacteraceae bacterium]|nr:ABC transporter permease [Bryobacteraceae bacterium]
MAGFVQDLRYGVRTLLKNPGFTAIAVLALALGIGANSAIFTVVNAVLLRPLPYKQPDRLAVLWQTNKGQGWEKVGVAGSTFMDWKEQSRLLEDICVFEPGTGTLTGQGEPEQFAGLRISSNFFQTLGVKPHLGRLFTEADEKQWMSVSVISYSAWQQRFGGDPAAIGRRMIVDGLSYTLIGVVEPSFWFPFAADGFVVWDQAALRRRHRLDHSLGAIGRLKPGVSLEQASAEMNTIEKGINERVPEHEGWSVSMIPLKETVVEYIRRALLVLLGAVGFVLLIACTNVANLLLARGAARQKEIAIRASMGAGRMRIVRQMLTESLVLSLAGGALGLLLAAWGTQVLVMLLPETVPIPGSSGQITLMKIGMDGWVLAFTFGISILTGIVFGMVPAISCSKTSPAESLKEGGRSSRTGTARWRGALVISEVALALVLLAGASLMLGSVARLQAVNPGFRSGQLLTFEVELPTDSHYRTQKEQG